MAVGSNFFYTVTVPVTLWFLDNLRVAEGLTDEVLFIDARHTFLRLDRRSCPYFVRQRSRIVGKRPDTTRSEVPDQDWFPAVPSPATESSERTVDPLVVSSSLTPGALNASKGIRRKPLGYLNFWPSTYSSRNLAASGVVSPLGPNADRRGSNAGTATSSTVRIRSNVMALASGRRAWLRESTGLTAASVGRRDGTGRPGRGIARIPPDGRGRRGWCG